MRSLTLSHSGLRLDERPRVRHTDAKRGQGLGPPCAAGPAGRRRVAAARGSRARTAARGRAVWKTPRRLETRPRRRDHVSPVLRARRARPGGLGPVRVRAGVERGRGPVRPPHEPFEPRVQTNCVVPDAGVIVIWTVLLAFCVKRYVDIARALRRRANDYHGKWGVVLRQHPMQLIAFDALVAVPTATVSVLLKLSDRHNTVLGTGVPLCVSELAKRGNPPRSRNALTSHAAAPSSSSPASSSSRRSGSRSSTCSS